MKHLLFPTSTAAIALAVQHWEWAFYLALGTLLTVSAFLIFYAAYRYLFHS